MARTLVAVGISSEADMFLTTAAAAPRNTWVSSPSAVGNGAGFGAAGAVLGAGAAALGAGAGVGVGAAAGAGAGATAAAGAAAAWPLAVPVAGSATDSAAKSDKNSCQLESTEDGSSLNRRYISSTSHSFCPNWGFEPFTAVFASLRLVRYSVGC